MQKKCEKCEAMFEAVRSNARFCSKPCSYAAWAATNGAKRAASQARYYEKNREEVLARGAKWATENVERSLEIKRAYYARNRERVIAVAAAHDAANPEKVSERKARYERTDAGRLNRKATTHRRRARIKANGGSFSAAEWTALVERCGNRCVACFTPSTAVALEPDHIVPIALGGSNAISNIQPLCRSCNARKAAKVHNYIEASVPSDDAPEPENGT